MIMMMIMISVLFKLRNVRNAQCHESILAAKSQFCVLKTLQNKIKKCLFHLYTADWVLIELPTTVFDSKLNHFCCDSIVVSLI